MGARSATPCNGEHLPGSLTSTPNRSRWAGVAWALPIWTGQAGRSNLARRSSSAASKLGSFGQRGAHGQRSPSSSGSSTG